MNYRGSTGFGQRSIDSPCGAIATNDVSDMMTALHDTLTAHNELIDPDKLCVVGSHGGFLTGHLIGQYPDTFRAAALRNPVTNIPAMVGVTDIPTGAGLRLWELALILTFTGTNQPTVKFLISCFRKVQYISTRSRHPRYCA